MKVVVNNIIPFKGFMSVNLFGVLFVNKKWAEDVNKTVINHESIHTAQMKELLYIFFYIAYLFEWIYRVFTNPRNPYFSISFEKEAYTHEKDLNYLKTRKHFAQWRK